MPWLSLTALTLSVLATAPDMPQFWTVQASSHGGTLTSKWALPQVARQLMRGAVVCKQL